MPGAQVSALSAAAADVTRAFATLGTRSAPLPTTVSVRGNPELPQTVAVTVSGVRVVQISLSALRRACAAGISPVTLVACALAERETLGDQWLPKVVGTGLPPADSRIKQYHLGARTTSVTKKLDRSLETGVDIVVCGDQGSGASELVAAWAAARAASGERGLVWLSPSDPADGAESIYETLLGMEQSDGYLVVVDGVQSNPHALHRIRGCVDELRDTYGLKVVLVATAWPTLVARLPNPFKGLRQIQADGAELVDLLLADARLTPRQRVAFKRLVGSNVHLVVAALAQFAIDGRVPDRAGLQIAVTGATTDPVLQEALYWFACLSVLEIDVPKRLAEGRFAAAKVKMLVERQLLWLSDGAYTIGSRARAGLVLEQALAVWSAQARWGDPAQIVWTYLNSAGEATIIAMLERMDLVGLIDDPDASEGTRYLAMTWDQRARLVRALAAHYLDGGTWKDCIGAAVFAAQVFAETNNTHAWRAVADYVRTRFRYDGKGLPVVVGDLTSDYADFPAIVKSMSKVEKGGGVASPTGWEQARDVDIQRFYLTWVLGLLLGFEGSALEHDPDRMEVLLRIAAAEQHPGSGWFYPMRVPWVTARIVLGLCQAGQTYESSSTVRLACDWLRRPVALGGALETWWHSGTGDWNTDEATTAMCLTALRRAGAPMSNAMETAVAWLLLQRSRWQREDHEIDLALVVEAMLLYQTGGSDLQQGVLALLQWALNVPDGGLPATDSDVPEDSLRLPFVAAQLTVVIWVTMMRELSAVIDYELRAYRPAVAESHSEAVAEPVPGSDPDPDATPTSVWLDVASVAAWHRAIDVIRETLAGAIGKRDRSKDTPEVAERISQLRIELTHLNGLSSRVTPFTPVRVLRDLEELGRHVCGDRWPHPPWPMQPLA